MSNPTWGCLWGHAKAVKSVRLEAGRPVVEVELGFPAGDYARTLAAELQAYLREEPGAGGRHCDGRLAGRHPRRPRPAPAAARHPQRHRRGLGQGRRRQVDHRGQPRAGPGARRSPGRAARRRHLRPQPAPHDGAAGRTAGQPRRQAHPAARGARHQGHVDRLPDRGRAADGLARPDGHAGPAAVAQRHRLGRARLPHRRHAARHGRHPAHAVAARARQRRGDRDHAAGHRAARRAQGPADVPEGQRAGARHRREHEHSRLLELRARRADLRQRRRRAHGGAIRREPARPAAARHPHPRRNGRWLPDRGRRARQPHRHCLPWTPPAAPRPDFLSPRSTRRVFPRSPSRTPDREHQVRPLDPPHGRRATA